MSQVRSLETGKKYKDTPIGKIPVDWEALPLSHLAEINMGQSPSSKDCNDLQNGLPFYQGNANFGVKYPTPRKWCTKPLKIAKKGDILISVRAPVGEINIAPHECCIGRGLGAIRANKINSNFLYQSMLLHRKTLEKVSQGSTFEAINRKDLSDFLIFAPPLNEQKKIAKILTTADDAIAETDKIIEKTKELKKGVMQKLLTRGIGHKKFKKTEIGEMPEEWVIVKLKDVAAPEKYSFVDGPFGSNLKSIHYTDHGVPVIQSQMVISGKFVPTEKFYVSNDKANELKRSKVAPGDIVIAKIGVNFGASATIPERWPDSILSGNTMKITPDKRKIITQYLQYVLHYYHNKRIFDKIVSTTAQPAITLAGVKSLQIPLPNKWEQKKIAYNLANFDDELDNEIMFLQKLKNLKNALMQILLTGKSRVKIN
jgi:type I restriction enzyme S subunit